MSDIEIDGQHYRCNRMATRTCLYVVKRLVPVLQGLSPILAEEGGINLYEALAALSNTIGMLSDRDADFIIDNALDCVRWQQGNTWQPLRAPGGVFMVGAADRLDVQLRLVWEVLYASLSDFSFAMLQPSQTAPNGLEQAPTIIARPTMGSTPSA